MSKKNFKITDKETGKEYWISRSCAVCVTVVVVDQKEDKMYLLASKRGSACPDFVGKWNLTCGYLDFDETLVEAAARELYEELGIIVKPEEVLELGQMVNAKIINIDKEKCKIGLSIKELEGMGYSY